MSSRWRSGPAGFSFAFACRRGTFAWFPVPPRRHAVRGCGDRPGNPLHQPGRPGRGGVERVAVLPAHIAADHAHHLFGGTGCNRGGGDGRLGPGDAADPAAESAAEYRGSEACLRVCQPQSAVWRDADTPAAWCVVSGRRRCCASGWLGRAIRQARSSGWGTGFTRPRSVRLLSPSCRLMNGCGFAGRRWRRSAPCIARRPGRSGGRAAPAAGDCRCRGDRADSRRGGEPGGVRGGDGGARSEGGARVVGGSPADIPGSGGGAVFCRRFLACIVSSRIWWCWTGWRRVHPDGAG